MTPYELAECIRGAGDGSYNIDAYNMLRQQADRIAELEKQSEPVAWMYRYGDGADDFDVSLTQEDDRDIPLYTTPQTKPLSDEEIANTWTEHTKIAGTYDVKDIVFPFARAIEAKVRGEK